MISAKFLDDSSDWMSGTGGTGTCAGLCCGVSCFGGTYGVGAGLSEGAETAGPELP